MSVILTIILQQMEDRKLLEEEELYKEQCVADKCFTPLLLAMQHTGQLSHNAVANHTIPMVKQTLHPPTPRPVA